MEELSNKLDHATEASSQHMQTQPSFSPKKSSRKDFNHLLTDFDEMKINLKKTSTTRNSFEPRNSKIGSFTPVEPNKLKREINLLT